MLAERLWSRPSSARHLNHSAIKANYHPLHIPTSPHRGATPFTHLQGLTSVAISSTCRLKGHAPVAFCFFTVPPSGSLRVPRAEGFCWRSRHLPMDTRPACASYTKHINSKAGWRMRSHCERGRYTVIELERHSIQIQLGILAPYTKYWETGQEWEGGNSNDCNF